jgi:hypothetical protein
MMSIADKRSPSVEVVTHLQYSQQALFKAELLGDSGETISEISQALDSRDRKFAKRLAIDHWPNPKAVRARLSVASQIITAAPPSGADPTLAPVVFEVTIYSQWFNRRYLWPALVACIGLWAIATLAEARA